MAISYDTIPSTVRLPLAYIEFDNSGAVSGTPPIINKTLLLGIKNSNGATPAGEPVRITRVTDAEQAFGRGSQLYAMTSAFLNANSVTDLWAIAVDNPITGAVAAGKITLSGTATKNGQLSLLIAGQSVYVAVKSGDTAEIVATAVVAAITANDLLPVSATSTGAVIDLTVNWSGITGNDIDVRVNYYTGQYLPDGISCEITPLTGGVGNPDLSSTVASLGDTWWNYLVNPFTDTENLNLLRDELADRFGSVRQIDGLCWQAFRGTHAEASTFGASRNDWVFSTVATNISPEPTPTFGQQLLLLLL